MSDVTGAHKVSSLCVLHEDLNSHTLTGVHIVGIEWLEGFKLQSSDNGRPSTLGTFFCLPKGDFGLHL